MSRAPYSGYWHGFGDQWLIRSFIKACVFFQLINSCSLETKHMIHIIDSDTLFDVVFLDFWEPGDIPYWGGYCKIITCLDFMTGFGI